MELQERGRRLWASLLEQDTELADERDPRREVALSACRTADRVELLERMAAEVPPVLDGKTHPVLVEVRQQSALLARLVAALRLPDEHGRRPQRRQLRGVHQPAAVSSLERARRAKTGG
ncbi:hypothetical protein ACFS2C_11835 [Prauserella oleivorans]|uniref:DUF222 domain-containing protein n=1 Tax=Prauserella oleivorans TaxID=1478153 RepID=A0ABW5W817_9PSEU